MVESTKFRADYIGWTIGIIAIIIAIWTYYASRVKPALSYSVDPNRAILVNAESPAIADFTIQFNGNTISRNNVTAATIYLWNAGSAATHQAQILSPLKIRVPQGTQIFKASIVRASRPICGVELHRLALPNEYGMSFNILEPQDGAAIQIIYGGPPNVDISVDGLIEGQDVIHRVFSGKLTKEEEANPLIALRHGHWQFLCGAILICIGYLIIGLPLARRIAKNVLDLRSGDPGSLRKLSLGLNGRGWLYTLSVCVVLAGFGFIFIGSYGPFPGIPSAIAIGK